MSFLNRRLDALIGRIETATALDPVAERVSGWAQKTLTTSVPLRRLLSGTSTGHPAHPAVILVPLGSWLAAAYLDAVGGDGAKPAAKALVGLGIVGVLPAALTGASDWSYTTGAERRVGLVHAAGNYLALGAYAGSWFARRARHDSTGKALGVVGLVAVSATGWLGGHLAYARGVGVDTTAFQVAPDDWTDVIAEADLVDETPTLVHAAGIPVLLIRRNGNLEAIADRCTHRGAPLHEGVVSGDCIECPWHGGRFRLSDGQVLEGPPTRSQHAFEVRTRYGSVQVRIADEVGSLRTNPVS